MLGSCTSMCTPRAENPPFLSAPKNPPSARIFALQGSGASGDCVRRIFCLGHARLCALPAQKARLSCQQPKILLARGTVQGGKQSAHGCCRLRQTDFLLGACTSVAPPPPRGRIHVCIILYIPCLILSGNEWRNGVPKIKRLWKSARYPASFPQPFYNKTILKL